MDWEVGCAVYHFCAAFLALHFLRRVVAGTMKSLHWLAVGARARQSKQGQSDGRGEITRTLC